MNTSKNEISTKALVFHVIMKITWLVIAMAMTYIVYGVSTDLFYVELGWESNFWAVFSGVLSFAVGIISNGLYDTAFD